LCSQAGTHDLDHAMDNLASFRKPSAQLGASSGRGGIHSSTIYKASCRRDRLLGYNFRDENYAPSYHRNPCDGVEAEVYLIEIQNEAAANDPKRLVRQNRKHTRRTYCFPRNDRANGPLDNLSNKKGINLRCSTSRAVSPSAVKKNFSLSGDIWVLFSAALEDPNYQGPLTSGAIFPSVSTAQFPLEACVRRATCAQVRKAGLGELTH